MNHLGLFEGIGGFSLAARWAGWHTVAWCEINPFGQQVLKYHFPNAKGHDDITKTDFTIYRGTVDIITGGFPCQPYSTAGKRLGKDDERHLWPQMLRAIREVQPRWVVGENVSGLVNWSGGWFSRRCKLSWKLRGTKYSRLYFQLQVSALRTEEIGSGLLLTPTTREEVQDLDKFKARMKKYPNGTTMPNLATQVVTGLLPTPQAIDGNGNGRELRLKKDCNRDPNQPGSWRGDLKDFATLGMLPTPATRDYKGARSKEALEASGRNHTNSLPDAFAQPGMSSQLNPLFVAEMMGFPPNWTVLPFQNGEANR